MDKNRHPMREQGEIGQIVRSGREASRWILDFVRLLGVAKGGVAKGDIGVAKGDIVNTVRHGI